MARPRKTPDPAIGQRVRDRRKKRSWSLEVVAGRAGISYSELSRIERGLVALDNRFLLADIAAALECSVEELVGEPVHLADEKVQQARAQAQPLREALIETDLDYPASRPGRPPEALADELDLLRYMLFTRWDYAQAGGRLPVFLREAHANAVASVDRSRMLEMMIEAYGAAHTWSVDFGTQADCWLAADRARLAAEALEDPVLVAFSEWLKALVCTSGGMYGPALGVASRQVDELAPYHDRPDGLLMRGLLQLTAGFAAYGLHRPAEGDAWMAEGAEIAGRLGAERAGERALFHDFYFGPTNVGIWRVAASADGDDPTTALRWAEGVDLRRLNAKGRHATYYRDTARALAHTGRRKDDEQAVSHLLAAERAVPQWLRTSPSAQETARALRGRLGGSPGSAVRGLCERMGIAA